jgi:predicted amidohydrolase YtcJ
MRSVAGHRGPIAGHPERAKRVEGPASLTATLFLAACALSCVRGPGDPMSDTTVYVASKVRTLDPGKPFAQALVVKGGKVIFVGDRGAAIDGAGGGARIVDLPGAVIVPGLVDAHAHLSSLGRSLSLVRLSDAKSADACVARMKAAGKESWQGDWLLGRGWDQNDWAVKEFPHKALLDEHFRDTPVWLSRVDGHAAWVNSKALAAAGIDETVKDPVGGRFLRDGKGKLTGVLIDNAMDVVAAKIPAATEAQQKARLKAALERCSSIGLTGVHDAGMDLETFKLLQTWDLLGALPLRLYAMADGQGDQGKTYLERGPYKGRHLTMRAVKFLADGALGSRGAALKAPYADEPSQSGLLMMSPEDLESRAQAFADRGFQVAVHAIGDKANTVVIDLLTRLEARKAGSRHRVEHAQILSGDDVPRFAQGGLIASFQPTHATSDMPWAEARVGKERIRFAYAWRSVLDTGAHVAFGSDFPVEDPEPLAGLYAARTRQDQTGKPEGGWLPEQKVTGEEALKGFTTGAAYAEFAEEARGLLKEGFDADFIALDVDPVDDAPRKLLGAKVLLTVSDGREVFRAR